MLPGRERIDSVLARFRAVILDLDGVLTRTATLHARAWKETFDAFLAAWPAPPGGSHAPFDADSDYLQHVDGKPRLAGVRDFLTARSIQIEEGDPADPPGAPTLHGLASRKNELFLDLLERHPIETYADTVERLRSWRDAGLRTGLITSSRNGRRILAATGLADEFDVVLDGNDAARLGLAGKPAPDIFLHAAEELGVEPEEAAVFEDALAGVQAASAGRFGLVVGVARADNAAALRTAGADLALPDLRQFHDPRLPGGNEASSVQRLIQSLEGRRLALFLDYDGTLTPIVPRPEDATISDEVRDLLRELAKRVPLAIVSGRDLADVRRMVGVDELTYAGSHGYDVHGPEGLRMQQEQAVERLPELDAAETALQSSLAPIEGVALERKRFAIAVHYRHVAAGDEARVEQAVDRAVAAHPSLRKKGGKKIFELQPDVPWDKGRAVLWLLERLGLTGDEVLPIYIGDDVTDEDAFEALRGRGIGIRVGLPDEPTAAEIVLHDTDEAIAFLRALLDHLSRPEPAA